MSDARLFLEHTAHDLHEQGSGLRYKVGQLVNMSVDLVAAGQALIGAKSHEAISGAVERQLWLEHLLALFRLQDNAKLADPRLPVRQNTSGHQQGLPTLLCGSELFGWTLLLAGAPAYRERALQSNL
jgi:hypothetical protein